MKKGSKVKKVHAKLCAHCGEPFRAAVKWAEYCGEPCKVRAWHVREAAKELRRRARP